MTSACTRGTSRTRVGRPDATFSDGTQLQAAQSGASRGVEQEVVREDDVCRFW